MAFSPGQSNNTMKEAHKKNKYLNTMKVKVNSNKPINQIPLKCDEIEHKKSSKINKRKSLEKNKINHNDKNNKELRKNTDDMGATEFMMNVKNKFNNFLLGIKKRAI